MNATNSHHHRAQRPTLLPRRSRSPPLRAKFPLLQSSSRPVRVPHRQPTAKALSASPTPSPHQLQRSFRSSSRWQEHRPEHDARRPPDPTISRPNRTPPPPAAFLPFCPFPVAQDEFGGVPERDWIRDADAQDDLNVVGEEEQSRDESGQVDKGDESGGLVRRCRSGKGRAGRDLLSAPHSQSTRSGKEGKGSAPRCFGTRDVERVRCCKA